MDSHNYFSADDLDDTNEPVVRLVSTSRLFNRKLIFAIPVAVIIIAGATGFYIYKNPTGQSRGMTATNSTSKKTTTETQNTSDNIRLIATGDWIAHDSVNSAAKQADGSYKYLPIVQDIEPFFKTADIRFCNDPILNGGESLGISGYPKFNSPTEFVTDMAGFGCNLVNTASNHSFDFTQTNIDNSVAAWTKQPNMLAVAGENQNQQQHDVVHYFSVKGVKFAFLAYTAYSNNDAPPLNNYGVNAFSEQFAAQQIQAAKAAGAQFIITSIRWGTEYSTTVNAEQQHDARFLADQGVNLVIGHGSHELQPVQQIKGSSGNTTTVWYSIGNFLNTQEPAETLFNGLPIIDINAKTLAVRDNKFLPIYMHYEWTATQAAADQISARHNLHMYLLENANQSMIDAQRLDTTIAAQQSRITNTLTADGASVPLISTKQL